MKPHPQIRKTIKWGGAAVTVLLVVVWIASGWIHLVSVHEPIMLHAGHGCIGVQRWNQNTIDRLRAMDVWPMSIPPVEEFHLEWLSSWQGSDQTLLWQFVLPIWPPVLLVLALTCAAWRLDILARRRARLNLCPKCNYDRAGIAVGAVCPECGSKGGPA